MRDNMSEIGFGAYYLTTPDVTPGAFAQQIEALGLDGLRSLVAVAAWVRRVR
jgi:hypothetical protein